jgi:hypothetical protein
MVDIKSLIVEMELLLQAVMRQGDVSYEDVDRNLHVRTEHNPFEP